ncbi:MAG: ABC transporter ATP-binding protein [Firmicutes bacterium]|nr:ABC transporter ATP-binding protein [Bacillota bacterium]
MSIQKVLKNLKYLEIKNLSFAYQTKQKEIISLENINLYLKKGEFVSIVGPSGCGKSTLLSIIANLKSFVHGDIFINEKSVKDTNINIGYMQQYDNLLAWRTVEKNILLGLEIKKDINISNLKYADNLIKIYGLANFKKNYPSQLSGGMRKRAALIRTLTIRPKILLLDEAFSSLDFQTKLVVTTDIKNILDKENMTTLMVTHDITEAIDMSNRVVVLSKRPGKIKNIYDLEGLNKFEDPLKRRSNSKFNKYFKTILEDLRNG